MSGSTLPAAILNYAKRQPRRSQAHEFIGYCGREDVSPLDLERALNRHGARIEPCPTHSAGWTFPDGSVLRAWMTGRSLARPLVQIETRDRGVAVERWWIWWRARWSCFERALDAAPEIAFVPSSPRDDRADDDTDAYRIMVNGHRVGEIVFDFEVRRWFLEAGSLLAPGCGCWLDYATPRAQAEARCLLAQALVWQRAASGRPVQ